MFDRICREDGTKHILTKPRSPTTTGKEFDSIEQAQAELDVWVEHYNHDRPHQGIGMVAPWERFRLANTEPVEIVDAPADAPDPAGAMPAEQATRVVSRSGTISFCAVRYPVAVWLAGERVEVVCDGGLVHVHHRGVVVVTHARKHQVAKQRAGLRRATRGTGARRSSASSMSRRRR